VRAIFEMRTNQTFVEFKELGGREVPSTAEEYSKFTGGRFGYLHYMGLPGEVVRDVDAQNINRGKGGEGVGLEDQM